MSAENSAILANDTFELVPRHPGMHIIDGKWHMRTKFLSDGDVDKLKARWVGRGFKQRPGTELDETFAHTLHREPLLVFFAIANVEDMHVHHVDISSARLNREIDEELHMEQPHGFEAQGKEDWVCQMKKALYGFKQSPRQWQKKLNEVLSELGFTRTYSDNSIWVYVKEGVKVILPA
jgi:hypothetical protein